MSDPYDLNRFCEAQREVYDQALKEIAAGQKHTHWMWFIFPQLDGLASSSTSKRYAITSVEEAKAYLAHPMLGPRLLACAEAALAVEDKTAREIFGKPDDVKLRSSATLFDAASPPDSVFDRVLSKYFEGKRDERTLQLIAR